MNTQGYRWIALAAALGALAPAAARAETITDQHIRMSDGADMVGDVNIPEGAGPFPVIVMDSPYGRLTSSTEYVDDGYVQLNVDIRGTGRSGGVNCLMCDREQQDVYEIVEWAARQPWSDSNVGMMGGSYLAFVQLLGAAKQPPHLKAIVPRVSYADLYRDGWYQNGLFDWAVSSSFTSFQPVASVTGGSADPAYPAAEAHRGGNPVPFEVARSHPLDGRYYRERAIYDKYDRITAPALFIGGWFDMFLDGMVRNFNGVASTDKRLILGPWTHHRAGGLGEIAPEPYPDVHLPTPDPILAWFDRYLKGRDNGVDRRPRVEYYDLGTDAWRTSASWPPAGSRLHRLHLSGEPSGTLGTPHDGSLAAAVQATSVPFPSAAAKPDTYVYDPTIGAAHVTSADSATFLTPFRRNDERVDEGRGVTYTSPELPASKRFSGPLELDLWAKTTGRDTDWVARLCDVAPDGSSLVLSSGYVRASHRAVDWSRSRPGLPWLKNTRVDAVPAGTAVRYRIPMSPVGLTLPVGHRLRLAVYSADTTVHEPLAEPATNTLLHDSEHPSVLLISGEA
jgi:putative CocE/NonD family hydrolase